MTWYNSYKDVAMSGDLVDSFLTSSGWSSFLLLWPSKNIMTYDHKVAIGISKNKNATAPTATHAVTIPKNHHPNSISSR